MTRDEVEARITFEMWNWGKGYSYDVEINGNPAPGMQWVRDNAEQGDEVRVYVYNTGRYPRRQGTEYFTIQPLGERDMRWLEERREQKRKKRDHQREKFYSFETDTVRNGSRVLEERKVDEADAKELVDRVWEYLGLEEANKPSVEVTSRLSRTSKYYPPASWMRKRHNHIGLAEGWGQDTVVLLHEVAHAATRFMKDEPEFPAHGEDFAGVTIALWSEFLECEDSDWAFLNSKAEEHGLDVSYSLLKDGS